MKIYCFYNELYREIFDIFSQSLKEIDDDLELIASKKEFTADDHVHKKIFGRPFTPQSQIVSHLKLDLILKSIKENPGESLIYSDVDTRFLSTFSSILKEDLNTKELLGMQISRRLAPKVASCFLAFKASPAIQHLFESVKNDLEEDPSLVIEESLNKNLVEQKIKFGALSPSFASTTLSRHLSLDQMFLFHAKRSHYKKERKIASKVYLLEAVVHTRPPHQARQETKREEAPKEGEAFILDFFESNCANTEGRPLNLDCAELQRGFHEAFTAPGCKSCARRRTIKKYANFINKAQELDREDPGLEISLSELA